MTPKIRMFSSQSDRTTSHCSLHGRITLFSSVHAGIKAWHRKWWTSGEQRKVARGMNGCLGERSYIGLEITLSI